MSFSKLRWMAFVALCGGTVFQTTTGCDAIIAPILSSVATSIVTGFVSNLFLTT
jgi:hypothetical protein